VTPLPARPADGAGWPPLSALNDLLFCERRAFLHRVEGVWADNAHTAGGSRDHRRVHEEKDSDTATHGRTARGVWVASARLRVVGVCDPVEFAADGTPFPVEYMRGKRRRWDNNEVQLCARGVALEGMLGVPVPAGALYFARTKRRLPVAFDARLRAGTQAAADRLHALLGTRTAPPPVPHPKCKGCSLDAVCLPGLVAAGVAYRRAAAALFRPA
jgi:CRISPR-associated exonuclease Cas4